MKVGRGLILCVEHPAERFCSAACAAQFVTRLLGVKCVPSQIEAGVGEFCPVAGLRFFKAKVGDPIEIPVFKDPTQNKPTLPEEPTVHGWRGPVRRCDTGEAFPSCRYAARLILSRGGPLINAKSCQARKLGIAIWRSIELGELVEGTRWERAEGVEFSDCRSVPIERTFPDGSKANYDSIADAVMKTGIPRYRINCILKTSGRSPDGSMWRKDTIRWPVQLAQAGAA